MIDRLMTEHQIHFTNELKSFQLETKIRMSLVSFQVENPEKKNEKQ